MKQLLIGLIIGLSIATTSTVLATESRTLRDKVESQRNRIIDLETSVIDVYGRLDRLCAMSGHLIKDCQAEHAK